ncbi:MULTISPECIES: magnesium transporter CorA family protein [unclassified Agrobacterium]|uniref:magnesium transporter CorA family protein n=1 Tax=unclassified Agrobacterium TaxID=2632611 RepID=UPI0024490A2B|nr:MULTISPECIES: magnesium transporter CorA family protein [unclassified Agrobacterium]MDH0616864.1 magnesium transporter CorA family protein [Agrobacterium sp. GD03872]MDH0699591.1 magnesium transporter CorA family protein [Agrobacterium sp. GD03871]MDH1062368.1 magnesium transporter CorA family protein [Agrobacterium sp. GD03992]MDH2213702.1 magnesium transporter CorA family protein [Agrobacterium sp. GD03643]MDH2222520.1 magnesium transporter CorA family protein [Agrobacterium sp. GD03638]
MINAYRANCEAISLSCDDGSGPIPDDIVWIDLVNPDRAEEQHVEMLLGLDLPTREDLKDIEPSSRLYMEDGNVFMTASLVWKADSDDPRLTDVAFILAGKRLVTIRYAEPKSFHLFIAAITRVPHDMRSGAALLLKLLETIVDRTAEILENSVAGIDNLAADILGSQSRAKRKAPRYLDDRLTNIAGYHRLISKVRDSLASLARLQTFLSTSDQVREDKGAREQGKSISRDIQSLTEHASFVSGNLTFLLDASLGIINIEQNGIIKIFSIASVVFLPPTLVASIYGMNFQLMPELNWTFGYPLALVVMLMSAIIPFLFFRWKGWL